MYYLKLNDWEAYRTAFHLSNYVWSIVLNWNHLAQFTIGQQFIDAVDSISANMAEGWGRYHKRDKIRFYHIAYGSCKECCDWNEKAKVRNLISPEQYKHIFEQLNKIPKGINVQIKYTFQNLKD